MSGKEHREDEDMNAPAEDARGREEREIRVVEAEELLGARGILRIEHRGEVYTLRVTRNDRLILTK